MQQLACLVAGLVGLLGGCNGHAAQGLKTKPSVHGAGPAMRPGLPKIPDTKRYDALLRRIVDKGRVDYKLLIKERAALDAYLNGIATADLRQATDQQKLTFYINAYNAGTLAMVLTHVIDKGPEGKDLAGVREVSNFFTRDAIVVAGRKVSLDAIETAGRALGDPRIHFAVNCASASCPVLRDRAWQESTLDRDLDAATHAYFQTRHGLEVKGHQVHVSAILKWYAKDFGGKKGVRAFLMRFAPKQARNWLDKPVYFLDYDWTLNKQRDRRKN